MKPSRLLALTLVLPLAVACSRSEQQAATTERPAIAVDVARVERADATQSLAVTGTLTPKFQSEVKPEYSGVISEVLVTEWVRVSKGTLLARFDRREPEAVLRAAAAARMQAEVGVARAKRELERSEKLRNSGLATQQQLDDARTAANAAEAQLEAARAQEGIARTRLDKTDVRAPVDGVVAARLVNPGDFIQNMGSGAEMFRIVDNRRLELTVGVPASDIAAVHVGQPLTFTVDTVPGRTFEGRVSFINPAADGASRTVNVVAVVDNSDGALRGGAFAKGVIVTGETKSELAIPRTALMTWDPATGAGAVFVVQGDRAQRRSVTTGAAVGDRVHITAGLQPGETIVSRGAFNLRDGDKVAVAAAAGAAGEGAGTPTPSARPGA